METIHLREISYEGHTFRPEKQKRTIHIWFPHFLEFHENLVNTLYIFSEWKSPVVKKFTVRGGYAMPKTVCDHMKVLGLKLEFYFVETVFVENYICFDN